MATDVVCCLWTHSGLDRAAIGVLGEGRRLADSLGGKLHAVLVGKPANDLESGAAERADVVHLVGQESLTEYQPEHYLDALQQVCSSLDPAAVLLGNDAYAQELAPRLAHRLKGAAVGDGSKVELQGGALHVTRAVYGGKATAVIRLVRSPGVVWLRARALAPAEARATTTSDFRKIEPTLKGDLRARIVDRQIEGAAEGRLEDARVIVSGGRGLGGPEPFEELKKLAGRMGAQVGASRAACDAGWVPPTWQVGQTGKKVAPTLYLAVAISGASQHLIGIADSQCIAAINTDAEAPIFKHCRFGIVEDYKKVVGPLAEKLAKLKG
ncbi:MAG: electron transfer flavoprotein subunit alpha/FixB family protein [Planctomycetota bacterium]